ncbi:pseudouridine synthase [Plectonema cf. radiosum LEGE 06105]|uniref:Pseudouridine synthase n=1 Tax=Plectonema cf. radiosum LEGE 06105 TaxID=945769 RepID=A0A8J7JTN4_9CYAN|nr:pseudouridine synthase [Plectonema radiosum]MBE9213959.1 pseudouridine synthase [Plectonema cf. radiosum LEGE 06105]
MSKKKYRYIIFYKPYGVLSQFSKDNPEQSTLQDYISVKNVYPVGRLDTDSEGLLLLTNHGQLQHRLCHPQFGHCRTYWVQVEGIPDATALNKLEQGVVIKNYRTQPAKVQFLSEEPLLADRIPPIRFRKNVPTAWLEMTLSEGKNRQVRRMTASVGFPTLRLVRVQIAHLKLDTLELGQWRDLTKEDVKILHDLVFSNSSLPNKRV